MTIHTLSFSIHSQIVRNANKWTMFEKCTVYKKSTSHNTERSSNGQRMYVELFCLIVISLISFSAVNCCVKKCKFDDFKVQCSLNCSRDYNIFPLISSGDAESITELALNDLPVKLISMRDFGQLPNLRHLSVTNMQLLTWMDISRLKNLETLTIENNAKLINMFDYHYNFYLKMKQLKVLNLRNNSWTSVRESAIRWARMRSVDLRGNSIKCNCDTVWIEKYSNVKSDFKCSAKCDVSIWSKIIKVFNKALGN